MLYQRGKHAKNACDDGRLKRLPWEWFTVLGLSILTLGCRIFPAPPEPYTGPQLPPNPSLEQIAAFVNGNSSQIQTIIADQGSLSAPGMPTLRTEILFERPWRLRMRGETSLSGLEMDVGSNDELFWFWVKRNEPPAFYFCRYADYDQPASIARRVVPIDPRWLVEALGVTQIDLNLPTEGPVALAGQRWEIRQQRQSVDGPMTKVIVVDGLYGFVLAQYLYDAQGRLLVSALSYDHRREPVSGLVLPRSVEVSVPASGMAFRLYLGNARINQPIPNPSVAWNMPVYQGYPLVNLADPRNFAGGVALTGSVPGCPVPASGSVSSSPGLTWIPVTQ